MAKGPAHRDGHLFHCVWCGTLDSGFPHLFILDEIDLSPDHHIDCQETKIAIVWSGLEDNFLQAASRGDPGISLAVSLCVPKSMRIAQMIQAIVELVMRKR